MGIGYTQDSKAAEEEKKKRRKESWLITAHATDGMFKDSISDINIVGEEGIQCTYPRLGVYLEYWARGLFWRHGHGWQHGIYLSIGVSIERSIIYALCLIERRKRFLVLRVRIS